MRILTVTNLYPNRFQPNRSTFNRHHLRALADRHDVEIIAPISWADEVRGCFRDVGRLRWDRRSIVDDLNVSHPIYYYPPGVFRAKHGKCFLWSIRRPVLAAAKRFKPDLLFSSFAYPDGYSTVRLAKELGLPSAVQVLGSDINLLDQFPDRRQGTWEALKNTDVVITVSEDLAGKVRAKGVEPDRVRVVYRGVDQAVFSPGDQESARQRLGVDGEPMLLFIGNLKPVKSIETLIEACQTLGAKFPGLRCEIIGNGPLQSRLANLITKLSLSDKVTLRGAIPQAELVDWYRACDLVVLPSLHEGVPNVLLEAIATGRPYVASRTGGIPEISQHAGCRLAEPGNTDDLARAIQEMIAVEEEKPTVEDLPSASWEDSGRMLAEALEFAASNPREKSKIS